MRLGIFISILLHLAIVAIGIYGLPVIIQPTVLEEIPMVVEIIPLGLKTNLSSLRKKTKKAELLKPKPLPVRKVSKAPPPFEPKPVYAVPPMPLELKPKTIYKSKPRVEVKPKQIIEQRVPKNLAKVRPRRKPKPPDRFAMVLKNLEKALIRPSPKETKAVDKKDKPGSELMERLSKSLFKKPKKFDPNKSITLNERHAMVNLIKRTMEPCWNFQAGSKQAQDIIVEIEVALRSDGYVSQASITNRSQLQADPFKLAAGESALRAVLNPSCQPYKLPANQYAVWKDLKLTFNPREMLGR